MISPYHSHAFWGVAYVPYLGWSPKVYFCPTTKFVDDQYVGPPNQDGLFKDGFKYVSYGFNGFHSTPNRRAIGLDLVVWEAKVNQAGAGSWTTRARKVSRCRSPHPALFPRHPEKSAAIRVLLIP